MAKKFVTLAEAMPAFFEKCLTAAERESCSLQDFMISNPATLNHYLYKLTHAHRRAIAKNLPPLSDEELTEIFRRAYLIVNRIISAAGLEYAANNKIFYYENKDYTFKNEIIEAYALFILEHLDSRVFRIYISKNGIDCIENYFYLYLCFNVSLDSMTKETMWLLVTEPAEAPITEPAESATTAPAESPVTEPALTNNDIIKQAVQVFLDKTPDMLKKHWFAVYKVVDSRTTYRGTLTDFCKKIEEWGFAEGIYESAKKNPSLPKDYDKWADYIKKVSDADKTTIKIAQDFEQCLNKIIHSQRPPRHL